MRVFHHPIGTFGPQTPILFVPLYQVPGMPLLQFSSREGLPPLTDLRAAHIMFLKTVMFSHGRRQKEICSGHVMPASSSSHLCTRALRTDKW
jgi:hypothetical protein